MSTLVEVMDHICHDNYVLVGTTVSVYFSSFYSNQEVVRLPSVLSGKPRGQPGDVERGTQSVPMCYVL